MPEEKMREQSLRNSPLGGLGAHDVAIAGGGLAGLALSIQCAQAGYKTVFFS